MNMDQWAFFDALKAGTVHNVYFFYGPEDYVRKSAVSALQKKLLMPGLEQMNCTVMQNPTAQQIMENCETLPMMSDYRLIIVQGLAALQMQKGKKGEEKPGKEEAQEAAALCAYIGRVPPSTCLVYDAGENIDKRRQLAKALLKLPGAVSFDTLDDAQLARWIGQQLRPFGKRMSGAVCEQLAFVSGRDLNRLSGELQKLCAYADGREEITAQDVEDVATHTAECTVFAMVDALVAGQTQRAFELLNILLESGEQRIGVLALITRQYRQMMYLRAMQDQRAPQAQMAKALGVPPFAVTRLSRQAGKRTAEQLREMVSLCVQADYDIKRGALREEAALDRLMLVLS